MDDWVFVDTCIWASFFTKPSSPENKLSIDYSMPTGSSWWDRSLLRCCLVFVARIKLIGSHPGCGWPITWKRNGTIGGLPPISGAKWLRQGHRLPLSDLVLAVVAKRLDAYVYTTDPHFDLVADLKRFRP